MHVLRMKGRSIVAIILVLGLLLAAGCGSVLKGEATKPPATSTEAQQVNDALVNSLVKSIEELRGKVAALEATNVSTLPAIRASAIDAQAKAETLQGQIASMDAEIEALNSTIQSLREALEDYGTSEVIGIEDHDISGLSVVYVVNNTAITTVGAGNVRYAQLAIKLSNANSYAITNVDVVGKITLSYNLYGDLAAGYPKLSDAAAGWSYIYNYNADRVVDFEVYALGGKPIVIPAGGTITLRPKIELLAAPDETLPKAVRAVATITAIAYDKSG